MINTNFIDAEIARHCPNPTPNSKLMAADIPLVLWKVISLAERGSYLNNGQIISASKLVDDASLSMTKIGLTIAQGSLVRKVCGPLLARYTALCVSRRIADADSQLAILRPEAEIVFCRKFENYLYRCTSDDELDIISYLMARKLAPALYSFQAKDIVSARVACAPNTSKIIVFGRELFR